MKKHISINDAEKDEKDKTQLKSDETRDAAKEKVYLELAERGEEKGAAQPAGAPSEADAETKPAEDRVAREKGLVDQLQRVAAEFENYKKRNAKEYVRGREDGIIRVVEAIVPTLESISFAIESARMKPGIDSILKGMEALRRQLLAGLETLGVREITVKEGDALDPNIHEVLLTERSGTVKPGHIVSQIGTGYALGGRLIKPAKVTVAREPLADDGLES